MRMVRLENSKGVRRSDYTVITFNKLWDANMERRLVIGVGSVVIDEMKGQDAENGGRGTSREFVERIEEE